MADNDFSDYDMIDEKDYPELAARRALDLHLAAHAPERDAVRELRSELEAEQWGWQRLVGLLYGR